MVTSTEKPTEIQYILVLLILFASFVVPWFEAFFFEFKVSYPLEMIVQ